MNTLFGLLTFALLAGLAAVLFRRVRARQRKADGEVPLTPPQAREARQRRSLRRTFFSAALQRMGISPFDQARRYEIPWCLMVGRPGSGKSTLAANVELHLPFGAPAPQEVQGTGCGFWLYDRGLLVDLPGLPEKDNADWQQLLKEVKRLRPLRPVDSLLLTLPAHPWIGPNALDEVAARAEGAALLEHLRRIQNRLGVGCPIYIALTGCDLIPGFQGFCRALPPSLRMDLLGWSNPHPPSVPYHPGWLKQLSEALYGGLSALQLELLAEGVATETDRNACFTFPAEVRTLTEALQPMLDRMFKTSLYEQPLMLRGVYLCGDPGLETVPEGGRRVAFATHLLGMKVFPEFGLAAPLPERAVAARRLAKGLGYALAAAVALAPLGLLSGWASLRSEVAPGMELAATLTRIQRQVAQARSSPDVLPDPIWLDQQTTALLQAMSRLRSTDLACWQLPTSVLFASGGELVAALRSAFERVVLLDFSDGLRRKEEAVLEGTPPERPRERALSPQQAPEFYMLRTFDRELERLLSHLKEFNTLSSKEASERVRVVEGAATYLLELKVGLGSQDGNGSHALALEKVGYREVREPTEARIHTRVQALAEAFRRSVFLDNQMECELRDISNAVAILESGGEDGSTGLEELHNLSVSLAQAQRSLASPEAAWIAQPQDLSVPFMELLASIRNSKVLGHALANDLEAQWKAERDALRRRLGEYTLGPGGPRLLAPELQAGRFTLSPEVLAFQSALEGFLAQPFIRAERVETPVDLLPGRTRVRWNEETVEQALRLAEPYQAFRRDELKPVPLPLRGVLRGLAQAQMDLHLRDLGDRARKVEPGPSALPSGESTLEQEALAQELAALGRASGKLRELLALEDRLELSKASRTLRAALGAHTLALLRRVDEVLEQEELYTPDARLPPPGGERPPALEAFDAPDSVALSRYLKTQRQRVEQISRELAALPLALHEELLVGRQAPPLLDRWRRIAASLKQRENLVPGNPVQALESFIQVDMMDPRPERCREWLASAPLDPGGDYFLGRLAALKEASRDRCRTYFADRVLAGYTRLAERFNETLSGRFPFSVDVAESASTEASTQALREFFRELNAYVPELEAALAFPEGGGGSAESLRPEALAFISQVREAERFLAPLLAADDREGGTVCSLQLEPRVNRRYENRANEIIDWRLEIEGQAASRRPVPWRLGESLKVQLRWAKDGPRAPTLEGQLREIRIDGTSASFTYGGRWALVRLLRALWAPSNVLERGVDSGPHTLQLRVLIERKPEAGGIPGRFRETAFAFARLSVTPRDGQGLLVAPREWPVRAPLPWLEVPKPAQVQAPRVRRSNP